MSTSTRGAIVYLWSCILISLAFLRVCCHPRSCTRFIMAHTTARTMNRRELLTRVVGGLLGSVVFPRRSDSQQTGLIPLNDRLSLVTAGGTNVLSLTTRDGLILVDSGSPELTDRLLDTLRPFSPVGRVATVFNTHWHLENTGGNERLRSGEATILAHANTRIWMATPVWVPAEDRYRPARPAAAQPTRTFYADGSMTAGRERIDYGYLIDAHTSGD